MGIEDIGDILEDMFGFIKKIGDLFTNLADGAKEMGEGLEQEVYEAPEGLMIAGADFTRLVTFSVAFFITNIMCAVKSIQNFYFCFLFYILEFIGQLAYLPVRIFLFCASFMITDIYIYERKFWEMVEKLDRILFYYIKFHIAHYPKQIRDKCYNCKRIKMTSMGNILFGTLKDISGPIPNNLFGGIGTMAGGLMKMLNALMLF